MGYYLFNLKLVIVTSTINYREMTRLTCFLYYEDIMVHELLQTKQEKVDKEEK